MLLRKRGAVIATALRGPARSRRSPRSAASVVEHVWPLVADGKVRPIVHTTLPMADAAEAHALMEASGNVGKILLDVVPRFTG